MELWGELPTQPVVFAACDALYFVEHGPAFVYSANDVNKPIHIHVVDPIPDVYSIAALLAATTSVHISFTFSESPPNLSEIERKTYYACSRFLVLPVLLLSAQRVLTLDIDCLLMQPFDFPAKDCAYFPRKEAPTDDDWLKQGSKVAAGAVYLTSEALNVAEAVAKTIGTLEMRWYADQIALSAIFQQIPAEFVHHFDQSFMDWSFVNGTVIWTGKGPRKYNDPSYVKKKQEYDRLKAEIALYKNVILQPRLDLPFKNTGLCKPQADNIPELRLCWRWFCEGMAANLESPLIIEAPRWMFNNTVQAYFPSDTVFFVPHAEQHNWHGNDNTLYYMQTVFPWLFTVDPRGWGGGAQFVSQYDPTAPFDDRAFEVLKSYAMAGGSKFPQPKGVSLELDEEFIFIPLQLPHDETIRWHSEVSCEEFVTKLCEWSAKPGNPSLVFKGHPINTASMAPLKEIISGYDKAHYVEALDIHEIIPRAAATYVINSGVGQEAMLFDAKVVAFGRCEYKPVTIPGDLVDLDEAWESVRNDDLDQRRSRYRSWYHWYLNEVCFTADAG